MLFLAVIWTGLIAVSLAIGLGVINILTRANFRLGDRFFIATWLGVIILGVVWLAISIILPLSPLVGALVAFFLVALAWRSRATRADFAAIVSTKRVLLFLAVTLPVAAFTSRAITLYDTGLYHFQVISWLSQFGAVPGLALIHSRLGFTSSWFALAAPFNDGILAARVGALTGGLAFLLAILQLLVSAWRIFKDRERLEDWFVVTSLFLCLAILIWEDMPVSSSTDLPIILLIVVTSWTILITTSQQQNYNRDYLVDARLIPLILSAGAVTIKLSALPLLFISGCFYIFGSKFSLKRLLVSSLISILLILPMILHSIVTSGCPLFPSSLFCLNLPWSVANKTFETAVAGRDWQKSVEVSPTGNNLATFWWEWLRLEPETFFLLIASLLAGVFFLTRPNNFRVSGQNYILALGGLGSIFIIFMAPFLRFGLGYFCLIPALLSAVYCYKRSSLMTILLVVYGGILMIIGWYKTVLALAIAFCLIYLVYYFYRPKLATKFLLMLLLLIVTRVTFKSYSNSVKPQINLLAPPLMPPQQQLITKQVNDVQYLTFNNVKIEERCWGAEIPCTPEDLRQRNIRLRRPEKGISSGFVSE